VKLGKDREQQIIHLGWSRDDGLPDKVSDAARGQKGGRSDVHEVSSAQPPWSTSLFWTQS
jgi:hypothetical protein